MDSPMVCWQSCTLHTSFTAMIRGHLKIPLQHAQHMRNQLVVFRSDKTRCHIYNNIRVVLRVTANTPTREMKVDGPCLDNTACLASPENTPISQTPDHPSCPTNAIGHHKATLDMLKQAITQEAHTHRPKACAG